MHPLTRSLKLMLGQRESAAGSTEACTLLWVGAMALFMRDLMESNALVGLGGGAWPKTFEKAGM